MYCNTILRRFIGDCWSCTQFSDVHALFVQKSGKIVEFKSYIYAINMLDMHDDRLLFLVLEEFCCYCQIDPAYCFSFCTDCMRISKCCNNWFFKSVGLIWSDISCLYKQAQKTIQLQTMLQLKMYIYIPWTGSTSVMTAFYFSFCKHLGCW